MRRRAARLAGAWAFRVAVTAREAPILIAPTMVPASRRQSERPTTGSGDLGRATRPTVPHATGSVRRALGLPARYLSTEQMRPAAEGGLSIPRASRVATRQR